MKVLCFLGIGLWGALLLLFLPIFTVATFFVAMATEMFNHCVMEL